MRKIMQLMMLFLMAQMMCCSPTFAANANNDRFPRSIENMYTLENNKGNAGVGSGDFNFFFDLTQGIPAWMYDNNTVSEPVQKGGYTVSTGKKSKKKSDTITYQSNK